MGKQGWCQAWCQGSRAGNADCPRPFAALLLYAEQRMSPNENIFFLLDMVQCLKGV
jgi:hypothetical protein